ncbi:MAG: hypothetical protein WCK77_24265 [Verrucomicrobiota bacterium]
MSPTITDPVLRRRLALGLISAPVNRNRRRPIWQRHQATGYGFELVTLAVCAALFAALFALIIV